jgi:hypothetical protein
MRRAEEHRAHASDSQTQRLRTDLHP